MAGTTGVRLGWAVTRCARWCRPLRNPNVLIAGAVDGVFLFAPTTARELGTEFLPENHEDLRNFDSIAVDPRDAGFDLRRHLSPGVEDHRWRQKTGRSVQKGMVSDSDVMSITIDAGNPLHVFSSACSGIYQSSDGGENWTKFKGIPNNSRRTVQIKQDPKHPENVYAATTEGLWRTVDDGANLEADYSAHLEACFRC